MDFLHEHYFMIAHCLKCSGPSMHLLKNLCSIEAYIFKIWKMDIYPVVNFVHMNLLSRQRNPKRCPHFLHSNCFGGSP